jgi:hypothetical protein
VLAIQAAHWHAERTKAVKSSPSSHWQSYQDSNRNRGVLGAPGKRIWKDHKELPHLSKSQSRPPRHLIVQMIFLYTSWCAIQTAMEAMVPMWMISPAHQGLDSVSLVSGWSVDAKPCLFASGGLGADSSDLGLAIAGVALGMIATRHIG